MEISGRDYRTVHKILLKSYNTSELKTLCGILQIPQGSIFISTERYEEAVDQLIDYCNRYNLGDALISNIIQDRPNHPNKPDLEKLILAQKIIFISCTPDLRQATENHLEWWQNDGAKLTYWDVAEPANNIVRYYNSLRREISQCSVFFSLIGKELGEEISDQERSRVEIEYDCAFFRGLPTYLFIPKPIADGEYRKKVDRLQGLQRSNPHHKQSFPYTDPVDLFIIFQDILYKIIFDRIG